MVKSKENGLNSNRKAVGFQNTNRIRIGNILRIHFLKKPFSYVQE